MRRRNLLMILVLTVMISGLEGFSQTARRPVSERMGSAAEIIANNRSKQQESKEYKEYKQEKRKSDRPGYASGKSHDRSKYRHDCYDRGGRGSHHNSGYENCHNSSSHNKHYRPGGYKPPVNQGYRPHHNHHRPYHHGHYCPPPRRPYRPVYRPVIRPVIPHSYIPVVGVPSISSVIGLAFRTSYYASLDYLFDRGYSIDGYDSRNIYLRDVREMGYNWEDVILDYDNFYLSGAQFISSKKHDSPKRYKKLYHKLCRKYGAPIEYRGLNKVTWFGHDRRAYITLEYSRSYINGHRRYYTILSYNYD